jgi:hypothetical protein
MFRNIYFQIVTSILGEISIREYENVIAVSMLFLLQRAFPDKLNAAIFTAINSIFVQLTCSLQIV